MSSLYLFIWFYFIYFSKFIFSIYRDCTAFFSSKTSDSTYITILLPSEISLFCFNNSTYFNSRISSFDASSFLTYKYKPLCFFISATDLIKESCSRSNSSTLSSTLSMWSFSWCSIRMCFLISASRPCIISSYTSGGPAIDVKCESLWLWTSDSSFLSTSYRFLDGLLAYWCRISNSSKLADIYSTSSKPDIWLL